MLNYKHAAIRSLLIAFFLLQFFFSYSQFSETIFHDTLTKVKDGYISSGLADGKFIYLSGSSFSEETPLPTVTKMDTSGNVIWTASDNNNYERFGDYYGTGNYMATCASTYKSGIRLYTIARSPTGSYNEVWCISDSTGLIIWKTHINRLCIRIIDYNLDELLLITRVNNFYEYHIVNKATGKVTFTKLLGNTIYGNTPNILVDDNKNILISWDDKCYKYRDKNLTQLLWTSNMPNNGILKMIDVLIQDSARYVFIGNNYARAVDSLTGNTIWYKPVPIGYVQGQQSGGDGYSSGSILKDSLLYITWISPSVGGIDLDRGFTLTRLNTRNGFMSFNVAYDFNGIPADPAPTVEGEMDWPLAMSMDANHNIYLSGSYDYSSGPANPGNWGIMKINGISGARIYEATITEDSTKRMTQSQGHFLYYYNGKMYCAGNLNKRGSVARARPLMLSFDTTNIYRENYRLSPDFVYRFPSALIGISAFSTQKMTLLKKQGQSSILELRSTNNQLIWSRTFSSKGKYIIPQQIKNLGDTSIAVSFIVYTNNTRYRIGLGLPDSILLYRFDSLGQIAFQRAIALNNNDTIHPVQIYTDKFGKSNFIFVWKTGNAQRFGHIGYMVNGSASVFGSIGGSEYRSYAEIPEMKLNRIQHYFGDTLVFYVSDEDPGYPIRNWGYLTSATQLSATGQYTFTPGRRIENFSKVYSAIKLDSVSFFIMGKSENGKILGSRFNHRLPTALVWTQISSFNGGMLNADTSATAIYTVSKTPGNSLYLSKINKATGSQVWDHENLPQTAQGITSIDMLYNILAERIVVGGYITDSTTTGNTTGYFFLSLDSSGNTITNIVKFGKGITHSVVSTVARMQNGINAYGGTMGLEDLGTTGFYNADCSVSNVTPSVTITANDSSVCENNRQYITFIASAVNNGSNPVYQWQVNGINAGTNANVFTSNSLNANDQVKVILTSNANCLLTNTATSNTITLTGTFAQTPAVSIIANPATPVCTGDPVTFTAAAVNPGPNPVYQWQVNGVNAGTNSNSFVSTTLNNNDQVLVNLTSNALCLVTAFAHSNTIVMTVGNQITPAITISGNTATVGSSSHIIAAAQPLATASLQWQDSTQTHNWRNIVGATDTIIHFTTYLVGNKLRCLMTVASCGNTTTDTSNILTFTANFQGTGLTVYPQPTSDILYIDHLKLPDNWETLDLVSSDGKQYVMSKLIANQTKISLDVKSLAGGVYIVILRRKDGDPVYIKFLKQ